MQTDLLRTEAAEVTAAPATWCLIRSAAVLPPSVSLLVPAQVLPEASRTLGLAIMGGGAQGMDFGYPRQWTASRLLGGTT